MDNAQSLDDLERDLRSGMGFGPLALKQTADSISELRATIARLTAELEVTREMNGALLEANEELGPALADAIAQLDAAEAVLGAAYRAALEDAAGIVDAWLDHAKREHRENRVMRVYLEKARDGASGLPVPADLAARLAKEAGE